jgi:hypothetical protein
VAHFNQRILFRPLPDRRARFPISIVKATSDPAECPVLGGQIGIVTAPLRQKRDGRDYLMDVRSALYSGHSIGYNLIK